MGVNIEDIPTKATTTIAKVEAFFRRNKKKAYRPFEIEQKFEEINNSTLRHTIRVLYMKGIITKKVVSSSNSWYYLNGSE